MFDTWSGPLLPFWVSSIVSMISVLSLYAELPRIVLTMLYAEESFSPMFWLLPGWSLKSSTYEYVGRP